MKKTRKIDRRTFISKTAAAGIGLTIVPSSVISGTRGVPPSDKINVGLIGVGTQALKMLPGWLERDEFQFVSVCDPNRESNDYPLWGRSMGEKQGAPGGREVGRRRINEFYAEKRKSQSFEGVTAYADFRELLASEDDLDALFILTPDHTHGCIALAGMEKNISIATHKPLANYMNEVRLVCNKAKETAVPTHCFAFQDPPELYHIKAWIDSGIIGEVQALHRWTNRPMWPQGSPYEPDPEPIPDGFDWQLWLGPSLDRPYSSAYTHTVFRGWYEFGAGCLADMGYYGFWKDWRILNLGMPTTAEASSTFTCEIRDFRSTWVKNNLSYPNGATLYWEVPVNGADRNMDVFWYEGGIKPVTPKSLLRKGKRIPDEGVMFVGDKGTILADYGYRNPLLLDVQNEESFLSSHQSPEIQSQDQTTEMITAFKGDKASRGDFVQAQIVAEAICLGNLAIRMDDRLEWDNQNLKVTNLEAANEFVSRKYRKGWEL